jgi:hypothetical protein
MPVALGGTDEESNLVSACCECNLRKGAKPLKKWLGVETIAEAKGAFHWFYATPSVERDREIKTLRKAGVFP